jgi:cytochrome c-type biogenesis protein CcmH/NrfG
MTNWKAVTVSLALALGWIMGNPAVALAPRPGPGPQAEVQMNIVRVESLTQHLRNYPEDVGAMEDIAALYMTNGSYDAAIGPLARGLQLDPHRRSLWVALDVAVIRSGRKVITDAELTKMAARFKESLEANSPPY